MDLSRQQGIQQATEQIAEQRARDDERQIQELKSKTDSHHELDNNQQVTPDMTQRLRSEHEQELLALKTRVVELEEFNMKLHQRATTITARHQQNDLVGWGLSCLMADYLLCLE